MVPSFSLKDGLPYVNQPATFLHLGCDPSITEGMIQNKYEWGWAPAESQNDVGSVIIVRKDKKPLGGVEIETLLPTR